MPRLLIVLSSVLCALSLHSCGGSETHDEVAEEFVETMNEFADTLAKITDKESAQKHVGELETLSAKVKDLQTRMEKIGEPAEADAEAMMRKHEAAVNAAMQKMMQESTRVAMDPQIMEVIGPTLQKM
jgi:archaellum component FlaC